MAPGSEAAAPVKRGSRREPCALATMAAAMPCPNEAGKHAHDALLTPPTLAGPEAVAGAALEALLS